MCFLSLFKILRYWLVGGLTCCRCFWTNGREILDSCSHNTDLSQLEILHIHLADLLQWAMSLLFSTDSVASQLPEQMKEEVKVTVQPNQEVTAADYSDATFLLKFSLLTQVYFKVGQPANNWQLASFPMANASRAFVLVHDVCRNWCSALTWRM